MDDGLAGGGHGLRLRPQGRERYEKLQHHKHTTPYRQPRPSPPARASRRPVGCRCRSWSRPRWSPRHSARPGRHGRRACSRRQQHHEHEGWARFHLSRCAAAAAAAAPAAAATAIASRAAASAGLLPPSHLAASASGLVVEMTKCRAPLCTAYTRRRCSTTYKKDQRVGRQPATPHPPGTAADDSCKGCHVSVGGLTSNMGP